MKMWHLALTGVLFMLGMEFSGVATGLIGRTMGGGGGTTR